MILMEFFEYIQAPIEFLKKALVYYETKYITYINLKGVD